MTGKRVEGKKEGKNININQKNIAKHPKESRNRYPA